jgi:hypothetical protein
MILHLFIAFPIFAQKQATSLVVTKEVLGTSISSTIWQSVSPAVHNTLEIRFWFVNLHLNLHLYFHLVNKHKACYLVFCFNGFERVASYLSLKGQWYKWYSSIIIHLFLFLVHVGRWEDKNNPAGCGRGVYGRAQHADPSLPITTGSIEGLDVGFVFWLVGWFDFGFMSYLALLVLLVLVLTVEVT